MRATERSVWGKRGEPTVSRTTSTPRSSVRASTISEKSSSPVGMTSEAPRVSRDGALVSSEVMASTRAPFSLASWTRWAPNPPLAPVTRTDFAVLNLGLVDGLDGDSDGTGEEAGLGPGDSVGNFDEAAFAHRNHLCHAALHAVADGLGLWAKTFQALGAPLAPSAGVGEEGDDGVSRAEGGDAAAHLGHHAGDLVAGN